MINPRRPSIDRTAQRAFSWSALLCSLCATSLLTSCAGYQAFREGKSKLEAGDRVGGLQKLREATEREPGNDEYRRAYFTQRDTATGALVREAEVAIEVGAFDIAEDARQRLSKIDAANPRLTLLKDRIAAARRHKAALDAAEDLAKKDDLAGALSRIEQVLSEHPQHRRAASLFRQLSRQQADASGREMGLYPRLQGRFRKPVAMALNNATLLQAFEVLKLASGLNFIMDREVKSESRTTVHVKDKPVEDVLRLLLATNQLESRVLDQDTVLIYPNTPAKAREYQELVVRSFYLTNTEVTRVANMLRAILKVRDVFVDEKLNMLVLRDSAEIVRLAERLIANQDLADPEVMLELEVMEVATSRLIALGIQWPDSVSASVIGSAGVGRLTLDEFHRHKSELFRLNLPDPLIAAQLRAQTGDSNLLANPRIRVRNKQTAKILLGERVPVVSSTSTANVGSTETVNYLDVGLKLEVEPTVTLDDEVAMKVALEVSNVLETIVREKSQVYRLGTRNASTTLRVKDGETQVLAGLIRRDEINSSTGIPLLGEVPLLGHLFSNKLSSKAKTEVVLLITPRIVRNLEVPGPGRIEMLSGTEASSGARPIQLGTPDRSATPTNVQPVPPVRNVPPPPAPQPQTAPVPSPAAPSTTVPPPFTAPPIVPSSPETKQPPQGSTGTPEPPVPSQ
jgi:general secretion pathway protein D